MCGTFSETVFISNAYLDLNNSIIMQVVGSWSANEQIQLLNQIIYYGNSIIRPNDIPLGKYHPNQYPFNLFLFRFMLFYFTFK